MLNKRVLESLIKSGAMDSLGRRAQLMGVLDKAIERGRKPRATPSPGSTGCSASSQEDKRPRLHDPCPNLPDWDQATRLAAEKEMLGFFITGHPLEKYGDKLLDFGARTVEEICGCRQSTGKDEIVTAGMLINLRVLKSRKGETYAQGTLEDMTGTVDLLVFPEAYRRCRKSEARVPVLIKAGVRVEEGANPKLTISEITPLDEAQVPSCRAPCAFACRWKPPRKPPLKSSTRSLVSAKASAR